MGVGEWTIPCPVPAISTLMWLVLTCDGGVWVPFR